MSIATTAILRNMLVEGMGQIAHPIDIGPVKTVGQLRRMHIGMRQGRVIVIVHGIVTNLRQRMAIRKKENERVRKKRHTDYNHLVSWAIVCQGHSRRTRVGVNLVLASFFLANEIPTLISLRYAPHATGESDKATARLPKWSFMVSFVFVRWRCVNVVNAEFWDLVSTLDSQKFVGRTTNRKDLKTFPRADPDVTGRGNPLQRLASSRVKFAALLLANRTMGHPPNKTTSHKKRRTTRLSVKRL